MFIIVASSAYPGNTAIDATNFVGHCYTWDEAFAAITKHWGQDIPCPNINHDDKVMVVSVDADDLFCYKIYHID